MIQICKFGIQRYFNQRARCIYKVWNILYHHGVSQALAKREISAAKSDFVFWSLVTASTHHPVDLQVPELTRDVLKSDWLLALCLRNYCVRLHRRQGHRPLLPTPTTYLRLGANCQHQLASLCSLARLTVHDLRLRHRHLRLHWVCHQTRQLLLVHRALLQLVEILFPLLLLRWESPKLSKSLWRNAFILDVALRTSNAVCSR